MFKNESVHMMFLTHADQIGGPKKAAEAEIMSSSFSLHTVLPPKAFWKTYNTIFVLIAAGNESVIFFNNLH